MEEEDISVYLKTIAKIQTTVEGEVINEYVNEALTETQEIQLKYQESCKEIEKVSKSCGFLQQILMLKTQLLESFVFKLEALKGEEEKQKRITNELKAKPVPYVADYQEFSVEDISNKFEKAENVLNCMQTYLNNPLCNKCSH